MRTAGQVLPGSLPKIHSQDLPSFLYASKRCSSKSDHRLCLLVLERPCSASLESPLSLLKSGSPSLESSSSSPLDGSTSACTEAPMPTKQLAPSLVQERPGLSTHHRIAGSPVELRRIAHLDGLYAPAREGSTDLFPRTAIVPHLGQRCILFWCPFNQLLRLQRCLMYLRMCSSVVIDVQCFGINR